MKRLKLEDGTRFTIGSTEIAFSRELALMMLASAQVETTLLVLKIAFLVLLYLFIWRIVRSAARDLRLPQESMILAPQQAAAAGLIPQPAARELGRLVVLASPALDEGDDVLARLAAADGRPRPRTTTCRCPSDEYASTRHARFEPRRDGVYVEDIGSTNGTFVNGIRLTRERRLTPGDVVRDRRDRPEVRAVKIGRLRRADRHRAQAPPQRGRVRRARRRSSRVADGMGGAQAGELASALAAGALSERERERRRRASASSS